MRIQMEMRLHIISGHTVHPHPSLPRPSFRVLVPSLGIPMPLVEHIYEHSTTHRWKDEKRPGGGCAKQL